MTREEAWVAFAAQALAQMMVGTNAVLTDGHTLADQTVGRVALAGLYADAMADQWARRFAGRKPLERRTPESKL